MHVIAKPVLVEFWTKHPDAEHPLSAWYRTIRTGVFADFNDLRATFASADYVDGLTVFNIGGNKYPDGVIFECIHRFLTGTLGFVSMNGICPDANPVQISGHFIGSALGSCEDQSLSYINIIKHMRQKRSFLLPVHIIDLLVNQGRRR